MKEEEVQLCDLTERVPEYISKSERDMDQDTERRVKDTSPFVNRRKVTDDPFVHYNGKEYTARG